MKVVIRMKGGKGSGHHGHSGRPGKVGGSSPGKGSFGMPVGVHTSEGQKKIIEYLQQETGMKFKPWGSLKDGGKTSANDVDISYVEPTEEESWEANIRAMEREQDLWKRYRKGEITKAEYEDELYNAPGDSVGAALEKVGYTYETTASWLGIDVYRYTNKDTQHTIEVWMPGNVGYVS